MKRSHLYTCSDGIYPPPDVTTKTYSSVTESLDTGDIVLFSGATSSGAIIKFFDRSQFSHIGLVGTAHLIVQPLAPFFLPLSYLPSPLCSLPTSLLLSSCLPSPYLPLALILSPLSLSSHLPLAVILSLLSLSSYLPLAFILSPLSPYLPLAVILCPLTLSPLTLSPSCCHAVILFPLSLSPRY